MMMINMMMIIIITIVIITIVIVVVVVAIVISKMIINILSSPLHLEPSREPPEYVRLCHRQQEATDTHLWIKSHGTG